MKHTPYIATEASFLIEPAALLARPAAPMVIDARSPERYAEGHIPGAIHLSTYTSFVRSTSEIGLSRFQREFARRYAAAGVTPSRPVVVYEDQTGMRAAREAWFLQYLGHPDVRILHGGLRGWRRNGGALDAGAPDARPASFPASPQPGMIAGVNDILARFGFPDTAMLDVRAHEEYTGAGGASCCKRQGRIPGAIRVEWTAFLDERTGRFKPAPDVRRLLSESGIDPEGEIITYCHRGARSAVAYYALRFAGCRRVRNFIGSWHEWAARNDLPIEAGEDNG